MKPRPALSTRMTPFGRILNAASVRGPMQSVVAWLVFFLALLAASLSVFLSPPTPDLARGLWFEAAFLADTGFDYHRMWTSEPGPDQGGAYNYSFTLLSPFIASLMVTLPTSAATFAAFRLFTIALASLALLFLYLTLASRVARGWAFAASFALATNPVFSVQAELLGMDLPLAVCSTGSLYCLSRGMRFRGLAVASVAPLLKLTGIMLPAAYIGTLGFCGLLASFQRRYQWDSLATNRAVKSMTGATLLIAIAGVAAFASWPLDSALIAESAWMQNPLPLALWLCPDLVALLVFVGVGLIAQGLFSNDDSHVEGDPYLLVFSTLTILGMMVLSWQLIFLVRYVTVALPLLFFLTGSLLRSPTSLIAKWGILGTIAYNLLNFNGWLLPEIPRQFASVERRGGPKSERSHAYRATLRSDVAVMAELDKRSGNAIVFADFYYGYMLATPRLGYVQTAKRGYCPGYNSRHFNNFRSLGAQEPLTRNQADDVLFVVVQPSSSRSLFPPVEPEDRMLIEDRLAPKLSVFQKNWRAELPMTLKGLETWRTHEGWSGKTIDEMISFRMRTLFLAGETERARAEIEKLLRCQELSADSRLALVAYPADFGDRDGARRAARLATEVFPNQTMGYRRLGIIELQEGNFEAAGKAFESAIAIEATDATALYGLGMVRWRQGDLAEAARLFRKIRSDEGQVKVAGDSPSRLLVQLALGEILLSQSQAKEGVEILRESVAENPQNAKAHGLLGAGLASLGDTKGAEQELRQAIRLDRASDAWVVALGNLLLATGRGEEGLALVEEVGPMTPSRSFLRARCLLALNRTAEAVTVLDALRVEVPGAWDVLNLLAWTRATAPEKDVRDGAVAIRLAEELCRATEYRNPAYLDTLAAAYGATLRFAEAAKMEQGAIEATEDPAIRESYRRRLEAYRQGRLPGRE